MFGWFMDPLIKGNYPASMRGLVGNRLPKITEEQSKLIKGSFDFIGLNYYTTNYASPLPPSNGLNKTYSTDSHANLTGVRNGVPIGPQGGSSWLYIYPQGFRDLLLYIKKYYGNPPIYITENGVDEKNNKSLPLKEALKDDTRIYYYRTHLLSMLSAIKEGANVKGYFAWSLLDNFDGRTATRSGSGSTSSTITMGTSGTPRNLLTGSRSSSRNEHERDVLGQINGPCG
ncbi:hypothetical protein PVAP13_7NG195851 [Panicum virgatum]|uniref:Uncharacterized protein n=1 Tax=Panicum virgatum TaxID=38727 RepID=A0A8T0Q5S1_PANVG|nr:hypothetical protein PVAP13_7NG195851 [Panicum virgatum]